MTEHRTRMSDSSLYDERCLDCGATDADGPLTGDCPTTTAELPRVVQREDVPAITADGIILEPDGSAREVWIVFDDFKIIRHSTAPYYDQRWMIRLNMDYQFPLTDCYALESRAIRAVMAAKSKAVNELISEIKDAGERASRLEAKNE